MILDQIKRYIPTQLKSLLKRLPIPLTTNHKYDLYTKRVLKSFLKPNSNCVDVGCYKGEILDLFLQYAPNGSHLAFEPIPLNFKHLEEDYKAYNNVDLYNCALSNSEGMSEFQYVTSNPSYSGLKRRSYVRDETIETVHVTTSTLDTVVKNKRIDCIKIDVEGAEYLVLEGAKQTILEHQPLIIFEHGKGASEYYGYSPGQLFDLFKELNCNVYTFESFIDRHKALTREELVNQFENQLNYYFIAYV